jgi:hypothetical protein
MLSTIDSEIRANDHTAVINAAAPVLIAPG